jgi:hypothetical protein
VRIQPAIARLLCMACASVVLILCPLGVFADANEDRLVRAIELFDQGQYTAAQEQLLKIRPDDLNEENRALRDAYVDRTRVAITMVEKAEFDFDRADDAIAREHFATARAALNDVLQNEYATKAQRDDARQRLEDIAELTGTTMKTSTEAAKMTSATTVPAATPRPTPGPATMTMETMQPVDVVRQPRRPVPTRATTARDPQPLDVEIIEVSPPAATPAPVRTQPSQWAWRPCSRSGPRRRGRR